LANDTLKQLDAFEQMALEDYATIRESCVDALFNLIQELDTKIEETHKKIPTDDTFQESEAGKRVVSLYEELRE
jgi:hypothetical protein